MGNFIDAKIARLKKGSAIETERFRQAQYLNWCKQKFVPDPCGDEIGYERLVACFIENLMLDCNSRSATAQGYAQSINKLFEYRGFPIPANPADKENMTSKLIHMREREENIARRRSPITKEIFVAIASHACDTDRDSAESVIFDDFMLSFAPKQFKPTVKEVKVNDGRPMIKLPKEAVLSLCARVSNI